ncbi:MAG TPA: hypothetical protein VEL31_08835 [Ktedonobacteraceae bacterium]|nr:hypothetical protein [Ktedonobacteraceae bacterium]
MAKSSENPLLGKNIPPPPPAATSGSIVPPGSTEVKNGNTVQGYSGITVDGEERERATVELSLYLRPSQDDKLEELRRAYKQRTKKKISANEVMRRLIEQATVEQIITKP